MDGQPVSLSATLRGGRNVLLVSLRHLGTTPPVSRGPIFAEEQIARAVELGLGVSTPGEIRIMTDDEEGESYARRIREILARG